MKILYFAWVRTQLQTGVDTLSEPCATVADVVECLKKRGERYCQVFADVKGIRVAVNQQFADFTTPVAAEDEIAFFPPVTGG